MENNTKKIVIMGNGPSLKEIDFNLLKNIDTFGLNSAYRKYEEINFYPTYYGSFDYKTIDTNTHDFQYLIDHSPIKKFFFARNKFKGEKFNFCNITRIRNTYKNPIATDFNDFFYQGNSGTMACQVAIMLGYEKIILIGIDQNYIEQIEGSIKDGKGGLIIKSDITKNDNYWFDNYQQKGESYNMPNKHIFHTPYWESLSNKTDIDIVNCSPISTLTCFRKGNLQYEINN
jgi:hypothetical protein